MNGWTNTTERPSIMVVGYGNRLRSDDGVGWRVAEELEAWHGASRIDVILCQQLLPELAERISRAKSVYFVDAHGVGVPGKWHCQPVEVEYDLSAFGHHATPGTLLALARNLRGVVPRAYLFSVCGESFEFGEELSPVVAAAVPFVVSAIKHHLMAVQLGSWANEMTLLDR